MRRDYEHVYFWTNVHQVVSTPRRRSTREKGLRAFKTNADKILLVSLLRWCSRTVVDVVVSSRIDVIVAVIIVGARRS